MTRSESPATRDKARTRRAILEAAEQLMSERGAAVSVAEIATAAEVSKSGLLHHFSSRESLILAVVENVLGRIWSEVHARVDLSENHPGKLTRAYVRTLTGDSTAAMRVFAPTSLLITLGFTAELNDVYERDAQAWRDEFAKDGLDPSRILVVRTAAEGFASLANSPYLTGDDLTAARRELLDLTLPNNDNDRYAV